MILAGDVGGTWTRLALVDSDRSIQRAERYRSQRFSSLEKVLERFLANSETPPEFACLAIAGPVLDNHCRTTNLPWSVSGADLAQRFGLSRCELVNDLVATAEGLADLAPHELVSLQAGTPDPAGPSVVIGIGTGLGAAILLPPPSGHSHAGFRAALPTEAGHVDFAPRTDEELALLKAVRREIGRVSVERVISGPGLEAIWRHLETEGPSQAFASSPCLDSGAGSSLSGGNPADDLPSRIVATAIDDPDSTARRALDLFLDAAGSFAGNLALSVFATGGVFLAGGIPAKLVGSSGTHSPGPLLSSGAFLSGFHDKGRFQDFARRVPVQVVLAEDTALRGSILRALR